MTITYHNDLDQGSDEWLQQRLGIITASEMKLIITPTLKNANNAKEKQHLYTLLSQRVTNHVEPQYVSDAMLRGHDDEITARDLYSEHYEPVEEAGFVTRQIGNVTVGYSPDGLVGKDGGIEVKSRDAKYQVQTIVDNEIPLEFWLQLQTGLFVTGRDWIDFISYSGGLPMFVKRMEPIETYQDAIMEAVVALEVKLVDARNDYDVNSQGLIETERTIEGILL